MPAISCRGAPEATSRPRSRIEIEWQRSASSMKWVETSSVVPASASENSTSQNSRRLRGSTEAVGSSRNSSSGSCRVAAASASRCFWPPDSVPARCAACRARSKSRSSASMRSERRSRARRWIPARNSRFSRTERSSYSEKSWVM
jgi:hypothetical protein